MELLNLAILSAINFFKLIIRGSLHLRRDRIRKLYDVESHGRYAIFRETISDNETNEPEVTLIVGFRLKLIGSDAFYHWYFQRLCILTTPFWSGFKGFKVKLWMVDPKTKNYLGIYKWQGKENAKHYVEALEKVLLAVSTQNSVWYKIREEHFEDYLTAHKI